VLTNVKIMNTDDRLLHLLLVDKVLRSAYLCVCLSSCLPVFWHGSKTTCPYFTKFSVCVALADGSALFGREYNTLYPSGLVDEDILGYILCAMLYISGQNQAQRYISNSSPGDGNGGEVRRLQLHCVLLTSTKRLLSCYHKTQAVAFATSVNKPAVIDSNFAYGGAIWRTRRNIRIVFDSGPFALLCENDVIHKTGIRSA